MTESTLSLTTDVLRDEIAIARFGGDHPSTAGAAYDALTDGEKERTDRLLSRALRRFYNPVLPGGRRHEWSFLSPYSSFVVNAEYTTGTITYDHTGGSSERLVTLASSTWPSWFTGDAVSRSSIRIDGVDYDVGTYLSTTTMTLSAHNNPGADVAALTTYSLHQDNYALNDDVGLVHSPLTFKQADNAERPCYKALPETIMNHRMFRHNVSSDAPRIFAVRPMARHETTGTSQQIIFWPSISSEATVIYKYRVRANALATDAGFPYGASDHSETILQACLAVVEEDDGDRGVHFATYNEMLMASVALDARVSRPVTYGFLGPTSERYGSGKGQRVQAPQVWSEILHESSP